MRRVVVLLVLVALAGCAWPLPGGIQQFVVFFRTDDATLSLEARSIVSQVVVAAHDFHPAKIEVEGHADGALPQDAALADRRAEAVVKALEDGGIDPAIIGRHANIVATEAGIAAHQVIVRFHATP